MSNARTLVVSQNYLDELRRSLVDVAMFSPSEVYDAQIAILNRVIDSGITVDMDHVKVAGFAKALVRAREIRQEQQADDQIYSEAQAADWMPAGGSA